jgi:hypothetical protein
LGARPAISTCSPDQAVRVSKPPIEASAARLIAGNQVEANYCGIRIDLVQYTVDRDPYKQGRFLPGTHIPMHRPDRLEQTRPDYVLVMDWNLKEEMAAAQPGRNGA